MAKKTPLGLASQQQLTQLQGIFGRALKKHPPTFAQADRLFGLRHLEELLIEKVRELTQGGGYIEREVFVSRNASLQECIPLEDWNFIGYKHVLSTLVTREQAEGRVPVVLVKPPVSYTEPGGFLDIERAFSVYTEMRIKPDLLAQAMLNRDPLFAKEYPNLSLWKLGARFYYLVFDNRFSRPTLIASEAGDRVSGDLWLTGVPI